jgi:ATP-dependent Clp endopeptidase proteolytic subunit ClpP
MTKEEKEKLQIENEKLRIEITALNAGIVKLEEETRHEVAETRIAEAAALKAEVEAHTAWRKQQKEMHTDEENHLYRFNRDVSSASVAACMSKLTLWHREDPKCDIEIVFSSPGGSIIDGFELFDFIQELRASGHKIITGSLGMAASMAGILLQAGDVRWIGHQAWMMIHRAAFGAIGKTYEVEDEVRLVKRIEQRIVDIFTSRSKLTNQKIKRNWDRKDWWIDADECLQLGLVDEIKAIMPGHCKASKPKASKPKPKPAPKRKRRSK